MTVRGGERETRRREDGETGRRRDGVIEWRSYYKDDCWFEGEFSVQDLKIITASDEDKAGFIGRLLDAANKMNPDHLDGENGFEVETRLEFAPAWGLGSSSSLTNLIADWFRVDPWELFKKTQSGSGYDITCARVLNPIWFRLTFGAPISQKVEFNPPFNEKLAFVYSGRKQDSAISVDQFEATGQLSSEHIDRISAISRELPTVLTLAEFNDLIDEHEDIMSVVLGQKKIKDQFPDFPGNIKSLGAWGGDFILATHPGGFEPIKSYFSSKGLNVVFTFDSLILNE
jgi:mevalonate kinase